MRLIHADKVQAEGLTFNDAGFIVEVSGAEYDGVRIDDVEIYTQYASYRGSVDQMIDQIALATRIDSKENGYRREALYRTPGGDLVRSMEQVNLSGPVFVEISYEDVVEWYQRDVEKPIATWPGTTVGSVFGTPRLHSHNGYSIIIVTRHLGQRFVVNAYPPQADLLFFVETASGTDDHNLAAWCTPQVLNFVGWCTRQELISRHEPVDLGYGVVPAIRDNRLNDMRDIPIPLRGSVLH